MWLDNQPLFPICVALKKNFADFLQLKLVLLIYLEPKKHKQILHEISFLLFIHAINAFNFHIANPTNFHYMFLTEKTQD